MSTSCDAAELADFDDESVAEEISTEHADDVDGGARSTHWRMTPPRLALLIGVTTAAALASLIGFLGIQDRHAQQSVDLRALYLQTGRQGAVNLTTIDWRHADADVQRILAGATGTFYDDFSQRSQPFVEVVKKVQSVSTGTVTTAGLESSTDAEARVLVAVSVQTTTNDAPQQSSRAWRMRLSIQKVGDDAKVSNVEFVP
ncbi:Mce protein [Mycolicibacterium sp. P9-64]|nr:Mce protein [Mycolicibacterium sp. P9-64]